jgi:ribosomal protein S18 acetylase RimI-like enzyme
MPLGVRQATPADLAVVVEFNRLLALESERRALDPAALGAGVRATLADAQAWGRYFLAEEEGAVLGQLGVTYEWSDWRNGWVWWLQGVYVRPEARRRGVFRALYEHACRAARASPDVVGLRLYVDEDNRAAQRTYERLGMARTGYLIFEKDWL